MVGEKTLSDALIPPFSLTPVGVVHCDVYERRAVHRGGSPATVEIFPAYADALDQVEHNSHVILFGWFHRADRTVLRTRPRKVAPFAHQRGVFASRSPDRPNPVAMTIVPLLARDGLTLKVADLDFIDGTPIVDVKPYCPGWDTVFSAVHRRRANPTLQTDEILREFYRRDLLNHVGRENADHEIGNLAVEACLLATRRLKCDPRDPKLCVTFRQVTPLMDGVMAITGASLSNGRLKFDLGRPNLNPFNQLDDLPQSTERFSLSRGLGENGSVHLKNDMHFGGAGFTNHVKPSLKSAENEQVPEPSPRLENQGHPRGDAEKSADDNLPLEVSNLLESQLFLCITFQREGALLTLKATKADGRRWTVVEMIP